MVILLQGNNILSKSNLTDEYINLLEIANYYDKNIYHGDLTNKNILDWICENLSNTREHSYKFIFNLFGYTTFASIETATGVSSSISMFLYILMV